MSKLAFAGLAIVVAVALLGAALDPVSSTTVTNTTITSDSGTIVSVGGSSSTSASSSIDCNSVSGPGAYYVPSDGGLPFVVGNNLYQCERILVIPPGSTGMLAVAYRTDVNATSPQAQIANFTAGVLVPVYPRTISIGPGETVGYTNANGITVTPSIPSVNVTAVGNESLTVTYTINVSNGTQGFFELQYLDECPTIVPLAVGYDVSQLNASSFPDYQPFLQSCTQLGMAQGGNLLSVSGIQMGWMVQSIQRGLGVSQDQSALQLRLSLNATSVFPGQSVSVSIEEYNTLPVVNNVTSANDWPLQYLSTGGCGLVNSPEGFAILQGHYTTSNISSAKPLQLYQPGIYSCPGEIYVDSYAFLPLNSTATLYGSCVPGPCFNYDTNTTGTVRGTWSSSLIGAQFTVLSPGPYTVVAGDEWGNSALAYFTVS